MSALYEFFDALQLQPIDNQSVCGDVDGCAVKVTLLGDEPLSLLLAFYVGTTSVELPVKFESVPQAEKIEVSLEQDFVWLTLMNLVEPSGTVLAESIRGFVTQLKAAGFAINGQCGLCGDQNVGLMLLNGQAVRICGPCLDAKQREAEELNRPNTGSLVLLPLGVLGVSIGWMIAWLLLDVFIEWLNAGKADRVLEINHLTTIPLLGAAFLLFLLGGKLGDLLWKSGASRWAPKFVSVLFILMSLALGELFYMTVALWRQIGIFNMDLTARLFVDWILSYGVPWTVFKLIMAACLLIGCMSGAANNGLNKRYLSNG